MKELHMTAFILLIIGGLNWLFVGFGIGDLGNFFGGPEKLVSRIIYILVGLAALFELVTHKAACKSCCTKKSLGGSEIESGMNS